VVPVVDAILKKPFEPGALEDAALPR